MANISASTPPNNLKKLDLSAFSKIENHIANAQIPPRLYHYTSSSGLIGIISQKIIWATHSEFLNDRNEIRQAVIQVRQAIKHIRDNGQLTGPEIDFIDLMDLYAESGAKRIYICSFSEEEDSLSQWRAYGGTNGGYAIGFPSKQISDMAVAQNFTLVKCIYDISMQFNICLEIVNIFLNKFKALTNKDKESQNVLWEFYQTVVGIGAIMKHPSFIDEKEWRVISDVIDETNSEVFFRETREGIAPYYNFRLVNHKFSNLVSRDGINLLVRVGPKLPSVNYDQIAVQFLLTRYLGLGCGHGPSQIPFKNW